MAFNESVKGTMEPIAWLFQMVTAVFMIFFLGVHLAIAHAYGISNILFQKILERLQDPWWQAFYIAFIVSVTYHGLNGLRGIILDMGVKRVKLLNIIFWVVAVATIIYAVWLLYGIIYTAHV